MFRQLCLKEISKRPLAWLLGHLFPQGNAFWRGVGYVRRIFSFGKEEKGNIKDTFQANQHLEGDNMTFEVLDLETGDLSVSVCLLESPRVLR